MNFIHKDLITVKSIDYNKMEIDYFTVKIEENKILPEVLDKYN